MAQHLPIQAKHHCQSKQPTRKQRTIASPPGSAHAPPGETVPDRLAVFTHRQVPASSQTHCFPVTAWRSTPCRQAPLKAQLPHTKAIAWRYSMDRQAPYQNYSTAGLGTLTDRFRTIRISQTSLFTFIITLCKILNHTPTS